MHCTSVYSRRPCGPFIYRGSASFRRALTTRLLEMDCEEQRGHARPVRHTSVARGSYDVVVTLEQVAYQSRPEAKLQPGHK